jgi:hypothetical protein
MRWLALLMPMLMALLPSALALGNGECYFYQAYQAWHSKQLQEQ